MRARLAAADSDAPAPPAPLRPLLKFAKLPTRAVRSVLEVLDSDAAFRESVAHDLEADQPDRPSWLFLTRPDGWQEELQLLADSLLEEADAASAAARLRTAERHLETTREALEETREQLTAAERRLQELGEELSQVRDERRALRRELAAAKEQVEQLGDERARAVRNLKSAEELAANRLTTIRELEAQLAAPAMTSAQDATVGGRTKAEPVASATTPGPAGPAGDEVEESALLLPGVATELAASFGVAAAALNELVTAFEGIGRTLTGADSQGNTVPEADTRAGVPCAEPVGRDRPTRRPRIRPTRGALENSPEGILQALRTPGVMVLVDGYNVAMQAWPQLGKAAQRDSLIRFSSNLAARTAAEFHLVFDGVGDGERPSVSTALAVRLHFSPDDTEADDVILEMLDCAPSRPAVVVSSDNRVRAGARARGALSLSSAEVIAFANSRIL